MVTSNLEPRLLSLVLPCYNPGADWERRILSNYLDLQLLLRGVVDAIEIIVVNDGSEQILDGEGLKELMAGIPLLKYVYYSPNRGKGYAVRKGLEVASGPWIIYTDVDFPYENAVILDIVRHLEAGADVVAGRRNPAYYGSLSWQRRLASKAIRSLNVFFLRTGHTDPQSGIKGMNVRGKALMLDTHIDGYLFDTEFVSRAHRSKHLRMEVVPIHLKEEATFSNMNLGTYFKELANFTWLLISRRAHKSPPHGKS